MILRPVRPESPCRATDDEVAGRVDEEVRRLLRHPAIRQRRRHCVCDQTLDHSGIVFFAVAGLSIVLGRDHHLGAADRFAVNILHGHLALGIRLEVEQLPGTALLRHHLQNLVCEINRRRHERALLVDLALVQA